MPKDFKTITKQIEILKNHDVFNETVRFQHIIDIYSFEEAFSTASYVMRKYLYCMTILRNLCAHGSRIYNRLLLQSQA